MPRRPVGVRLARRRANDDAPAAHGQEEVDVRCPRPEPGPDRLGEEVAGPQSFGVRLEEVVPARFMAHGRRFKPVSAKDVPHRGPGYVLDTQLAQLSEDTGVALGRVLPSQPDYQLPQFPSLAGPADAAHRSSSSRAGPEPAAERVELDDGDQVLQRPAQRLPEPDQPPAFARTQVNPLGQPAPQDPVFGAKELGLPGEVSVGRVREGQEQGFRKAKHGAGPPVRRPGSEADRVFQHRLRSPAEPSAGALR